MPVKCTKAGGRNVIRHFSSFLPTIQIVMYTFIFFFLHISAKNHWLDISKMKGVKAYAVFYC